MAGSSASHRSAQYWRRPGQSQVVGMPGHKTARIPHGFFWHYLKTVFLTCFVPKTVSDTQNIKLSSIIWVLERLNRTVWRHFSAPGGFPLGNWPGPWGWLMLLRTFLPPLIWDNFSILKNIEENRIMRVCASSHTP